MINNLIITFMTASLLITSIPVTDQLTYELKESAIEIKKTETFKKTYANVNIINPYATNGFLLFSFLENKQLKYGFINLNDGHIIEPVYDNVSQYGLYYYNLFMDDFQAVEKDGKWGYINGQGQVVIDFTYDDAYEFSDGFAIVKKKSKYGIIDKKNQIVLPIDYETIAPLQEGFYNIQSGDDTGVYHTENGLIIEPKHHLVMSYDNLIVAEDKNKTILYNAKGKVLKTYKQSSFNNSYNMVTVLPINEESHEPPYVIIYNQEDKNGADIFDNGQIKEWAKPIYDSLYYDKRRLHFSDYKKMIDGTINLEGDVKKSSYDYEKLPLINGMRMIYKDSGVGFEDDSGKTVIAPIYQHGSDYDANGYTIMTKDNGQNVVFDKKGQVVLNLEEAYIEPIYDYSLSEPIINKRFYRVLNEEGMTIFDIIKKDYITKSYEDIELYEDHFIVYHQNQSGLLTLDGIILVDLKDNFIYEEYEDGYFVESKNNQYYLTDLKGNRLHKNNYDRISGINEYDKRQVYIGNKVTVTDRDGLIILEGLYDQIFFIGNNYVMTVSKQNSMTTFEIKSLN
ncbi:WG repeat-containing protein [Acidaminobacter sp. JC074]|uniref:WG repeat-containing protein n=1 Tax=Acidaminobacter sp. JC074 TaxID=2530199 RepID=UPI001F0D2FEC|nr:WG repeat-containing protein [Acidaminobacter sp. JC074]